MAEEQASWQKQVWDQLYEKLPQQERARLVFALVIVKSLKDVDPKFEQTLLGNIERVDRILHGQECPTETEMKMLHLVRRMLEVYDKVSAQ